MTNHFKIVHSVRIDVFEEEVAAYLNTGWEVHGQPYYVPNQGHCQAMRKFTMSEIKSPIPFPPPERA